MAAVRTRAGGGGAWLRSRPPRVLHVITALGTGGAERQLADVVGQATFPTRTVALYDGGIVGDAMVAAGHEVEVIGTGRAGRPGALAGLVRAIRRHRPDIVHVHLLAAQLWGIPAARLAGVPVVISSEHSLMDTSIENRRLTPQLRATYLGLERMTTHTVAVSETTRTRLVRWGVPADRITVVENGIDFDRLRYSAADRERIRVELGVAPAATLVGAVGRLEAVKRPLPLLEALAPTLRPGERELVLVGDGPQRAEIYRRAQTLDVLSAVHLTGPRPDVPALLSAMDVLVSASRDETFGMAVIEGLGAGLPVVHAQCPALDELGAPCTGAFPLAADRPEPDAIEAGVRAALAAAAGGRLTPDPALADRYGIKRAAAELEDLYLRVGG
jgi:glycosyltransferase involved in cell wall biosynthesis